MNRNLWLLAVSLTIGPLIGALVYLLFFLVTSAMFGSGGGSTMYENWYVIFPFAYVVGFFPAFGFAIAMMLVSLALPTRPLRLIAAPILGAAIGLLSLFMTIGSSNASGASDPLGLVAVILVGMVTGHACQYLAEYLHGRPKPPSKI